MTFTLKFGSVPSNGRAGLWVPSAAGLVKVDVAPASTIRIQATAFDTSNYPATFELIDSQYTVDEVAQAISLAPLEFDALEGRDPREATDLIIVYTDETGAVALRPFDDRSFDFDAASRMLEGPFKYGRGTVDEAEACVRDLELPRACLVQQNPGVMSYPHAMIAAQSDWLQIKDGAARLELWTRAFAPAQRAAIRDRLKQDSASGPVVRRILAWVRGLLFERAIRAAENSSLKTTKDIQKFLHGVWEPQAATADESDEATARYALAGPCPAWPRTIAGDPGSFRVLYDFSAFERKSGPYWLPDVDAVFKRGSTSAAVPELVSVSWRFQGEGNWTAVPKGSPGWDHAKRLLRLVTFLMGQYDHHVSRGHLLAEAAQIALSNSPDRQVRRFLQPFLQGTVEINNFGNGIIFGETGVLVRGTGLTTNGGLHLAQHCLGRVDWRGFQPRDPLWKGDSFAHAAQAYWKATKDFVEETIPDDLVAWKVFVDQLVDNFVPCSSPASSDYIPEVRAEIPLPPGAGRRALHAIDFTSPTAHADVTQLVSVLIYNATFVHTWVNDRQRFWGGNLVVAPLGVRSTGFPKTMEEYWDKFAPSVSEAALQMLLVEQLSTLQFGHLDPADWEYMVPSFVSRWWRDRSKTLPAGLQPKDVRISPSV